MIPNAVRAPFAVGLAVALLTGGCVRSTPAPVEYHGVALTQPPTFRTAPTPRSGRTATSWSASRSPSDQSQPPSSSGGVWSSARSAPPPGAAAPVANVSAAAVSPPPPSAVSLFPAPPRKTVQAASPASTASPNDATIRVRRGDTVYGIANRLGVAPSALIQANGMRPPYALAVGQRLVVPDSRVHVVRAGESLSMIARTNDVSFAALAHKNAITRPYRLRQGQRLIIPNGAAPAARRQTVTSRASVKPTARPAKAPPRSTRTASANAAAMKKPAARPIASAPPPRSGSRFAWPVQGTVISGFGGKQGGLHNDGINIAVPSGTRVKAAENGVVAYAGNELPGFGNLLLIRHDGGFTTAYAHTQALLVKAGEKVRRGQVVAKSGSSGNVAKPQLHFEIRRDAKAVNPMKFLGSRQQARGPNQGAKPAGS